MSSLKELTQSHHKQAEEQPFVGIMFGGGIAHETYAVYLWNLYLVYSDLEELATNAGLLADMPGIYRADKIKEDFDELWSDPQIGGGRDPQVLEATHAYRAYLNGLQHEPERLWAHCYTRHMGDLSGGQMLKARVPGSGKMFDFDNADDLRVKIRSRLHNGLAPEVEVSYEFATLMFKQMFAVHQEAMQHQKEIEIQYANPTVVE